MSQLGKYVLLYLRTLVCEYYLGPWFVYIILEPWFVYFILDLSYGS